MFELNQKGEEKSDRFRQSLAAISFWALMQGGRPAATGHVSQCCRRAGQLGSANQIAFRMYPKSKGKKPGGIAGSLEGHSHNIRPILLSQTNYMHSYYPLLSLHSLQLGYGSLKSMSQCMSSFCCFALESLMLHPKLHSEV